jgi:hypothetical protein
LSQGGSSIDRRLRRRPTLEPRFGALYRGFSAIGERNKANKKAKTQ